MEQEESETGFSEISVLETADSHSFHLGLLYCRLCAFSNRRSLALRAFSDFATCKSMGIVSGAYRCNFALGFCSVWNCYMQTAQIASPFAQILQRKRIRIAKC